MSGVGTQDMVHARRARVNACSLSPAAISSLCFDDPEFSWSESLAVRGVGGQQKKRETSQTECGACDRVKSVYNDIKGTNADALFRYQMLDNLNKSPLALHGPKGRN